MKENWINLDARHVWHPFTPQRPERIPILVERARGSWLYTPEGRGILDAISSWWVNLHGHAHPAIADALYSQASELEHVLFAGFTHRPAVELATRLTQHLPGDLDRIFYSDNGSTAVEVGLKMALQFWHNQGIARKRIIALEGAYHGDTFGAMAVSGRGLFNAPFDPFLFPVEFIPAPLEGQEAASLEALGGILSLEDTAVFLYEPLVQGSGGMRMYSPQALRELLHLARQHGALLMADEVMTGFYRCGKLFASEIVDVVPDLTSLSKGLTGGAMALGITMCTPAVYAPFCSDQSDHTFFHGHSYTANPLACAAAIASLELTLSPETSEAVARISDAQQRFVQELQNHPLAGNPRATGTILAFDLQTGNPVNYLHPLRDRIYAYALERNVLLRPLGNTIYTMPPYCVNEGELSLIHEVMREILDHARNWSA